MGLSPPRWAPTPSPSLINDGRYRSYCERCGIYTFRAGTATNSVINVRSVSSALSVVVSAGSTLGFQCPHKSAVFTWWHSTTQAPSNLCVSPSPVPHSFPLTNPSFTLPLRKGCGGADSVQVIYSLRHVPRFPSRYLGFVDIQTGVQPEHVESHSCSPVPTAQHAAPHLPPRPKSCR